MHVMENSERVREKGEWVVHSIRPSIAGRRQWLLMTSDVNIGVTGEVPLHFANYRFDVTIPWNLVLTIWLRIIIFPSGHINHLKTVDYLVLHIQLPLFVCRYWHIFLYFNCWIWVTANRTFFFPSSFIQFFVSFSFFGGLTYWERFFEYHFFLSVARSNSYGSEWKLNYWKMSMLHQDYEDKNLHTSELMENYWSKRS